MGIRVDYRLTLPPDHCILHSIIRPIFEVALLHLTMHTCLSRYDHLKRRTSSSRPALPSCTPRRPEYRYTPLKKHQIRLLKLYPGHPEARICCSLQSVDLLAYDDIKAESTIEGWECFETISYVWGTDGQKVEIICSFRIWHNSTNVTNEDQVTSPLHASQSILQMLCGSFAIPRRLESCGQMRFV